MAGEEVGGGERECMCAIIISKFLPAMMPPPRTLLHLGILEEAEFYNLPSLVSLMKQRSSGCLV